MSISKKRAIAKTKEVTGWAYQDNLWFSSADAHFAARERDALLKSLQPHLYSGAKNTKLYTGTLSAGCQICMAGKWGCNFINTLCSRNCFFCPQDRSQDRDRKPHTDSMYFSDAQDHVAYINMMRLKGVAFSGGEPLLAANLLIEHVKEIRKAFGDSIYIWVYTNGDPVDKHILRHLQKAGVNELRFDLSARDYDLSPLRLARGYLPRISIEIPAIPEHTEEVIKLMPEWCREKVDHVNLHQLVATPFNYRAFRKRGYHILHQENTPVYESEISALKLLSHTIHHESPPVHYCSQSYKGRWQQAAHLKNMASLFIQGFEEITEKGYVRRLTIHDSPIRIAEFANKLAASRCSQSTWCVDLERGSIKIHPNLVRMIDWNCEGISISYLKTTMVGKEGDPVDRDMVSPIYDEVYRTSWLTIDLYKIWEDLYIHGQSPKLVMGQLMKEQVQEGAGLGSLIRNCDEIMMLKEYECIDENLDEVF